MKLWYEQPASEWMQALPVGNGRIGAMVFSEVCQEKIILDEESIWSGHKFEVGRPDAHKSLENMRQLLFSGRVTEAKELAKEHFIGQKDGYGTHLQAGSLIVETGCDSKKTTNYKRQLDLETAVISTDYISDDIQYFRETFASYVDGVVVIHLKADKPASINLKLSLQSDREGVCVTAGDGSLVLQGNCHNGGVEFGVCVKPILNGGVIQEDNKKLVIANADSVTLLVDIASAYNSEDYLALCHTRITQASKKNYEQLKEDHITDYQALFQRVSFSLGGVDRSDLPTDVRLKKFQSGSADNGLITEFFQYGRYLTISSSRPGTLPSHLQGLWNDNKASMCAWNCDYHLDINTQMNYWPAEVCNLSECHQPLFDFIDLLIKSGRNTARKIYDCSGWVVHVFTDLWGYAYPGWSERWGMNVTCGLWLALHLADHYCFVKDEQFLRERAYPVLKEAAMFYADFLVAEPKNGWLVTCPSASPENMYRTTDGQEASVCAGPTCDNVLLRELFGFCIKAANSLGIDEKLQIKWQGILAKLPPYQLTGDGRIREWLEDYDEPEPNHRHTSHLLGLYPFPQISPDQTPDLVEAAFRVLERKVVLVDWEDTEWCRAWNICFYARLMDAQKAYENIKGLFNLTDKNLMAFSPPHAGTGENVFVMDGNCGGTAGIAEMLLQSYDGKLHVLPALPKEWPDGQITGLCGRGGYEVDIYWQDEQLRRLEVRSKLSSDCQIKYNDKIFEMQAVSGQAFFEDDGVVIQFLDLSS